MRLFVLIGAIVNNDYDRSMIQERRTKGRFKDEEFSQSA